MSKRYNTKAGRKLLTRRVKDNKHSWIAHAKRCKTKRTMHKRLHKNEAVEENA